MRIVHLSAEFAPIAKAGGLGEVLLGLTRELSQAGHDTEVILPKYDTIDLSQVRNLEPQATHFKCLDSNCTVSSGKVEGCQIYFLEPHHSANYFNRGQLYACEDDIARFLYFSRAALEYLALRNEPIDILHLHDWHVSICAALLKEIFKDLPVKAVILSIHNMQYQGKCGLSDLESIGLKGAQYLTPELFQDDNPKFPNSVNLLKGGIVFSDAIVPVSPTYAEEILTPEFSFGLDSTLKKYRSKIRGILNGIDKQIWDPETDPHISAHYALESVTKGKQANRGSFRLNQKKTPWVGAVTRLVPQKGVELIEEAIQTTVQLGGSFILLGSSPIQEIQSHFNELQKRYQHHEQVLLSFEYNEEMAHLIYAALDLLLVPSHFEPCGLTQMIAMRYGTVPIVRATGGLKDTVFDCNDSKIPSQKRNGFTFQEISKRALNETLYRAFDLYRREKGTFQTLIRRGMQTDFSWKNPTREYLKLYRSLLKNKDPIELGAVKQ